MKLAAERAVEMTVGAKPYGVRPHLGNRCAIPTFPPPRRLLDCFLNSTPERRFPRPPAQASFRLILRLEKTRVQPGPYEKRPSNCFSANHLCYSLRNIWLKLPNPRTARRIRRNCIAPTARARWTISSPRPCSAHWLNSWRKRSSAAMVFLSIMMPSGILNIGLQKKRPDASSVALCPRR